MCDGIFLIVSDQFLNDMISMNNIIKLVSLIHLDKTIEQFLLNCYFKDARY
jgi:hypothetical protein